VAFVEGLERAGEPGGLLGHLFGVRAKGLFGELDEGTAGAFLSGLMIGHEFQAAIGSSPELGTVTLIGAGRLVDLYAKALAHLGRESRALPSDVAASGHARLARALIDGDAG
jgi:2-dehydro-3-deoxygalactonokinase